MRSLTFCMKSNAQQLSFEAFSHIVLIFGSVELQTESTFPFLCSIIFQRWQSLESPSPTCGEDRRMRPLTFLYAI